MASLKQETAQRSAGGIQYTLESRNVKGISITVKPGGSIWVAASRYIAPEKIDAVVERKADFIMEHLTWMAEQPQQQGDYDLTFKDAKNISLRVRWDGTVLISAPYGTPIAKTDAYVESHVGQITTNPLWMITHEVDSMPDCQQALELFTRVSEQYFPLFEKVLGGKLPELRVWDMPKYWGLCSPSNQRIALKLQLAEKPLRLVEYVVLHEYCHFVHLGHKADFWELLESCMPDARARDAELDGDEPYTAFWCPSRCAR